MKEEIKRKIKYTIILILSIGAGVMSALLCQENRPFDTLEVANSNHLEYTIFVDAEEARLYLLQGGKIIKKYKCSGGKWNTPSPIGTWKITRKAKWGEGFGRKLVTV